MQWLWSIGVRDVVRDVVEDSQRWGLLATLFLVICAACGPAQALVKEATVPYSSCFERSGKTHRIAPDLLKAVAATESNFNPNARSHANAHGVMQIQWPGTAKHLGVRRLAELYSPCKNIELGARYLRELLDKYANNERRALAAYNYGPGRIKAKGTLPKGAQKYIATVNRHRGSQSGSQGPRPVPTPKVDSGKRAKSDIKQMVASFSSRIRARRYRGLLERKIPAARFQVEPARFGKHAVMLTSSAQSLSADDRTLLKSLGWSG